ncbi:1-deoxy-D-xylulose-5-phosphate reductoisomerase [bacterium]|nr:1-deoxy-D-xylulose-5-phosphate reductoisomerase [bacterium]
MPKRVTILGSTGSIGASTLDVIRDFPDRFQIVGLSTRRNGALLNEQITEFSPEAVCVASPEQANALPSDNCGADLLYGEQGLLDLVRNYDADILVVATVGFAGLFPTMAGIERGMRIALANKEVLVVAGDIVMAEARARQVPILPIDSEHNAIFQCLNGGEGRYLRRAILTASGGPFREFKPDRLKRVTRQEALNHPTWNMGPKITIDSATLMNKGFEMIEACHLFGLTPDQVDIVIHPQSTVHSMVEFTDGSILAQLGQTTMYLPILNVLAWPERLPNRFEPLDMARIGRLDFSPPDPERFRCLDYAYEACRRGGSVPAVLNAANEVAVEAFLGERIGFTEIPAIIREAMDNHHPLDNPTLEDLREVDRVTREKAHEYAGSSISQ